MSKTEKRVKGDLGEDIACSHLKDIGYKILERNHKNNFGEIDIIAKKNNVVVFVEVKSQSVFNANGLYPERNVHPQKERKLIRTAEYYLIKNNYDDNTEWQIDVIGVELDHLNNLASLRHLKNAVTLS